MVIPWVGYSLAELVKRVEPTGNAKFVQFVTLADKSQMPGLRSSVLDWPYVEGLRLDEALHPLTMLAFGLYGEVLPNQNGAPVRLVVPWKYGFKSAKSIVRIRFVDKQPKTSWETRRGQRVRLLFQRQPEGRPPALEPGHRAPHRRRRPAQQEAADADVQRLRGPGRAALRRHGPGQVLLTAPRGTGDPASRAMNALLSHRAAKPLLFVLALGPFAWLLYGALTNGLGPNPAEALTPRHRRLGAALPVPDAGRHAAAPDRPAGPRWRGCAACSGCLPSSTAVLHLLCYAWLDMGFDARRDRARHPEAALRAGRHAGAAADAAAGRHLLQPGDPRAGSGALAATAPTGVCDRAARTAALLLDAQRQERLCRSRPSTRRSSRVLLGWRLWAAWRARHWPRRRAGRTRRLTS